MASRFAQRYGSPLFGVGDPGANLFFTEQGKADRLWHGIQPRGAGTQTRMDVPDPFALEEMRGSREEAIARMRADADRYSADQQLAGQMAQAEAQRFGAGLQAGPEARAGLALQGLLEQGYDIGQGLQMLQQHGIPNPFAGIPSATRPATGPMATPAPQTGNVWRGGGEVPQQAPRIAPAPQQGAQLPPPATRPIAEVDASDDFTARTLRAMQEMGASPEMAQRVLSQSGLQVPRQGGVPAPGAQDVATPESPRQAEIRNLLSAQDIAQMQHGQLPAQYMQAGWQIVPPRAVASRPGQPVVTDALAGMRLPPGANRESLSSAMQGLTSGDPWQWMGTTMQNMLADPVQRSFLIANWPRIRQQIQETLGQGDNLSHVAWGSPGTFMMGGTQPRGWGLFSTPSDFLRGSIGLGFGSLTGSTNQLMQAREAVRRLDTAMQDPAFRRNLMATLQQQAVTGGVPGVESLADPQSPIDVPDAFSPFGRRRVRSAGNTGFFERYEFPEAWRGLLR